MSLPGLRLVFRRVDEDRDLGFVDVVYYHRVIQAVGEDLVIELDGRDQARLARSLREILEGRMDGKEEMEGSESIGAHAGENAK